jgi:hypothetical protein
MELDSHLKDLLDHSQISDPSESHDVARLVEAILQDTGWSPSEVIAMARPNRSVLAIAATGHARAVERGMFKKRIEIERVSYRDIAGLRACERGVRGRDGSFIEGTDARGVERFSFGWSVGGGDPAYADMLAERAAAERDRVVEIMRSLTDW